VDGASANHWGNVLILPAIVTFMCIGFGVSESIVERSLAKAFLRGVLALPLGIILGFIFQYVADIIYNLGLGICAQMGVLSYRNPAAWIARGIAWAVFGAAGGTIYGIVGQSFKKAKYGIIGGLLGAALGGTIFDPIAMATKGGAPSRAVGFALVGIATGVAMGLVESALKDRWLYVTAGPLAGKQFILYNSSAPLAASNSQTSTCSRILRSCPSMRSSPSAVRAFSSRRLAQPMSAAAPSARARFRMATCCRSAGTLSATRSATAHERRRLPLLPHTDRTRFGRAISLHWLRHTAPRRLLHGKWRLHRVRLQRGTRR